MSVKKKHSPPKSSSTAKLKRQLTDATANWHRALADYQNLVKRTAQQKESQSRLATKALLVKLLPVYDHLRLASENLKDEGLNLIVNDFRAVIESVGVTQVEAQVGTEFDPQVHECVELDPSAPPGQIASQLKPGYILGGQLLYPAKVTVGGSTT